MQTTSGITNYDAIIASGKYQSESKLVINNVDYGENLIMSLKTIRGVFDDNLFSIGNAYVGRIDATIRLQTGVTIPKAAEVKAYIRIFNSTLTSGWLQKGVFYIYQREINSDSTVMSFVGFDAMYKGNALYPSSTLEWTISSPKPRAVLNEIASAMGVSLDARTQAAIPAGTGYTMLFPAQYNMREVLQSIAVMYTGNFCMSDTGELLFVGIADIEEPPEPVVQNVTYTVEFDPNATGVTGYVEKVVETGTNPLASKSVYLGGYAPSRTGYTFVEWNTQANRSGAGYSESDFVDVSAYGTVKLYAIWEPVSTSYLVNENGNAIVFGSDRIIV